MVLFEGQLGLGSQLHVFRSVTSFISQVCSGVVRLPGDTPMEQTVNPEGSEQVEISQEQKETHSKVHAVTAHKHPW